MPRSISDSPKYKKRTDIFVGALVAFIICGVGLLYFLAISSHLESRSDDLKVKTRSVYSFNVNQTSAKDKVLDLLPPSTHWLKSQNNTADDLPDWTVEHWTPIEVRHTRGSDADLVLCKLDFRSYYHAPHVVPMFKDLVRISSCKDTRKRQQLSSVLQEIESSKGTLSGRVVHPTAFIFHESRVGSTLVANLFASSPWAMVYSESSPTFDAIMACKQCTRAEHIQLFRGVVTAMGRSPVHRMMFFKFQSITSTVMDIVLEAYPDVPWVFLYRNPIQTVMSHLLPRGSRGKVAQSAPCLRSRYSPPAKVKQMMERHATVRGSDSTEAWCAAHLNMLCEHALEAYAAHGLYPLSGKQRGLLVNYDSLPGIVPRVLFPMLGLHPSDQWLDKMNAESSQYSKARTDEKSFAGDSEDKEERASEEIVKWASAMLDESYNQLDSLSARGIQNVVKEGMGVQSSSLKEIPKDSISVMKPIENSLAPGGAALPEVNVVDVIATDTGTGSGSNRRNPITNRIDVGPFSGDVNSSRFERVRCPPVPVKGYPKAYNMKDVLDNWNTDDTSVPSFHYNSLCYFDYQTEYNSALAYRRAEVPFVVYNIPEVDAVVEKWKDMDYINNLVGADHKYETETSEDNHFMYYSKLDKKHKYKDQSGLHPWKKPTGQVSMTFSEWLEKAKVGHNRTLTEREHFYFRVSSTGAGHFLFNELPFYRPKPSLFIVDPSKQRGIHCRFGMSSVIAEAHFDGSRNYAASLGGLRRWILAHPNQCDSLYLLPQGHPSARHSSVDWSKPDYGRFPKFSTAQVNEIIVRPGNVLYLPTAWFHYIVSLNINFQCNTRSGKTTTYDSDLRMCGF